MMGNYLRLDFGTSYFQDRPVVDLVLERMPVSISLGLWSLLLIYLISIPLGVAKAVCDGQRFDLWTSAAIFVGYAIPGFLFAILLVVLFAGGTFWNVFPLRGLVSPGFDDMTTLQQIADYFWHLALPLTALVIGSFATLTMLTKNSFLDQIRSQYVITARAKGLTEHRVLYGHVFRNGMLIIIAGFPGAFVGILFTGALLIEIIFSLDGTGAAGLRSRNQPRLSRHVRHALHLHPAGPRDEPDRRPDVRAGRPTHRLRKPGRRMMNVTCTNPCHPGPGER